MRRFIYIAKRAGLVLSSFLLFLFVTINLLALREPALLKAPSRQSFTVISNVAVIDPRGDGTVMPDQMVLITGNVISFVGPNGSRSIPNGATVIAGQGKYLIPGLWDSHVHTLRLSPQLHFPLLIANGVTSVRDMGNTCSWAESINCESGVAGWRTRIANGDFVGPRLVYTVTFHLEELPEDNAELDMTIQALKRRGERFLKIQLDDQIASNEFARVMEAAGNHRFPLAGHLPFTINFADVTHAFHSVEHDWSLLPHCSDAHAQFDGRNRSKSALLSAWSEQRCKKVLEQMVKSRTAYVPTHIASTGQDYLFALGGTPPTDALNKQYVIAPQRFMWNFMRWMGREITDDQHILKNYHHTALRLTKAAHDQGVVILAGSDSLDPDVIHGFGIHRELQYLVEAGLTPAQALATATTTAATHFGEAARVGSIESGKLADMILLDENPLLDIRNTQQIALVIADGRIYGDGNRSAALAYVKEQAQNLSMICRFLRGLWFND